MAAAAVGAPQLLKQVLESTVQTLLTQDWNKATLQGTVALQNPEGLGLVMEPMEPPPLPPLPPPVAARR